MFVFGVYVTVPIACFRRGMAREYLETELIPPPSTCYGFLLSLVGETDRHRHVRCRVTSGIFGKPEVSVVLRKVWRIKNRNGWKNAMGDWLVLGDSEQKAFNRWLTARVASVMGRMDTQIPEEFKWADELENWDREGRPDLKKSELEALTKGRSQDQVKEISKWISMASEFTPLLGSGENNRPDFQQLLTDVRLIIWLDSSEEPDQQETLERRVRRALNPAERGKIERFGGLSLGESTHMVDIVSALESCQQSLRQQRDFRMFQVAETGRLTLPVWVDHVGSAGTRYATGNLETIELGPPALERMPVISP